MLLEYILNLYKARQTCFHSMWKDLCSLSIQYLVMSVLKIVFIIFHLFTTALYFIKSRNNIKKIKSFLILVSRNYCICMFEYIHIVHILCECTHTWGVIISSHSIHLNISVSLNNLTEHDCIMVPYCKCQCVASCGYIII